MAPAESLAVALARVEEQVEGIAKTVTGIDGRMRNLERAAWLALGIATAAGAATGSIASVLSGGS
jgi:hypothetical protein